VLVLVAIRTGSLVRTVDPVRVASGAVRLDLGVCVAPEQRETSLRVVIPRLFPLAPFDVAVRARLIGELAVVGVLVLVAASTSALAILELLALAVANTAADALVPSDHGEPEFRVIDLGASPGPPGGVAPCTFTQAERDRVLCRVTIGALPNRNSSTRHLGSRPAALAVAGSALDLVSTRERKTEPIVIDGGPLPSLVRGMARGAVGHRAPDRMGCAVATRASARGSTRHVALGVALEAGLIDVHPL
jgi:hypothetical protein